MVHRNLEPGAGRGGVRDRHQPVQVEAGRVKRKELAQWMDAYVAWTQQTARLQARIETCTERRRSDRGMEREREREIHGRKMNVDTAIDCLIGRRVER